MCYVLSYWVVEVDGQSLHVKYLYSLASGQTSSQPQLRWENVNDFFFHFRAQYVTGG